MRRHQRLEQSAMIWNPQVLQFMRDDEILEAFALADEVRGERDRSRRRTGAPFPVHLLHANAMRPNLRPSFYAVPQLLMIGGGDFHERVNSGCLRRSRRRPRRGYSSEA